MKLTQSQFNRMSRHKQTQAYFEHESNQSRNKRGMPGPSFIAQLRFTNDWLAAFSSFSDSLPQH